jgi:hypothetical protein
MPITHTHIYMYVYIYMYVLFTGQISKSIASMYPLRQVGSVTTNHGTSLNMDCKYEP